MIKLRDISKVYANSVVAIENLTLTFKEGELIVLKGKSGSGKSTTLSLIAALLKPTSGEVIVDSKHISKLPDHFASEFRRDNIGFIFQKYNLIADLSVKENILLPLVPKNYPKDRRNSAAIKVMKEFNIEHKADELVRNLSGGEQQRCAIARANVANPKIILADEPTANLDLKLSKDFIAILKEMKRANKSIIVATHDPLFFDLDFVDRIIDFDT